MSIRRPVLALLPAIALAGCGDLFGPDPGDRPELITELPRALSPAESSVIHGSNEFAFGFLRELFERREGQNVFTSPLSASMAFGMAMNGAEGETWTQMRDALGFDGLSEQEINEAYRDLIALLLDLDPSVRFALGNSIWADDEWAPALLPDFVQRVQSHFDAEARTLDFDDPSTVDEINGWVAEATDGRIDELLRTIPPDVVLYLVNAIYFNGDWRHQFDPDETRSAPFETLAGEAANVPMMQGKVARRALFGVDATVVELPYGGAAFSAVAVLPPQDQPMDAFLETLEPALWDEWMTALEAVEYDDDREGILVHLPKIELEWESGDSGLIDAMRALGMIDAFEPFAADFSRMTGAPDLYIQQAIQKTFLKVDEEGTEAAAATAVGMGPTSAPPSAIFDRPFVLAIRERLSGTILFLGVIGDPSAGA